MSPFLNHSFRNHCRLLVAVALLFGSAATTVAAADYLNPVRGGDYPDPSVIRTADGYWATATSSEWAPHFPLLYSRDLVNWELRGSVFSETPQWAMGSFWAPEITEYKGTYFVYYTARRQDRRLAVAVATADSPGGPYTDHGELVAQEMGSIDAMAFTDQEGVRWLVWKEDGNSQKKPTIMWLQKLSADGLSLVGERHALFDNDQPWEGAVVEGPFVLWRDGYYYMFYSGAGCCGKGCNYAFGAARAKDLLGPWEKCPRNPLIEDNDAWRCPGHGSVVESEDGRYWLLYHAYAQEGFVATGRQMVLDEITFRDDGWPEINHGEGTSVIAKAPTACAEQITSWEQRDDFDGIGLAAGWQWLPRRDPGLTLEAGKLVVPVRAKPLFLAQSVPECSFRAETSIELVTGAETGLGIIGDPGNYIWFLATPTGLSIKTVRRGQAETFAVGQGSRGKVRMRVASLDGRSFRFAYANDAGQWIEVGPQLDGAALPPWDRGLRCGLITSGTEGAPVNVDYFTLRLGGEGLLAD